MCIRDSYNAGAFSCAPPDSTEDGYQTGDGLENCTPHSSDFEVTDFSLSLSEVLRAIQFFNLGGYNDCPQVTEDGFCPGP